MNFEYPINSPYIEDLEMHIKMLEKRNIILKVVLIFVLTFLAYTGILLLSQCWLYIWKYICKKNYLEIVLNVLRCIRQIKWVEGTKISLCVLPYLKVGVLIFNTNINFLFFLYLTIICLWLTELWLRWEKPKDITYIYFCYIKNY